MIALFQKLDVTYERVACIDVLTDGEAIAQAFDFQGEAAGTKVEMACTLSHIRAWERFLDSGEPAAAFFEDDVHFSPAFRSVLDGLAVDPDEEAIWKLETFNATVTAERQSVRTVGGARFYEIHTNHAGTAAYVLPRAMARRLWSQRRDFRQVVDTELFDPQRRSIHVPKVYQCVPAPCIQDQKLFATPSAPFLGSMLGASRRDVLDGVARQEPAVLRVAKALGRPAYRTAYSMFLGLSGRQRILVRYG